MARYFFLPVKSRQTTWEQSNRFFERETEKVCKLTESLSLQQMQTPVLIARIQGIENASRFWSPAMVLEHLMIVAPGMAEIIVKLSQGLSPEVSVDISATKPKHSGDLSSESLKNLLEGFSVSMGQVKKRVTEEVKNRNSRSKLIHPWFGPLTAREWNWLLATHQRIHRRQIEEIQKHYLGR